MPPAVVALNATRLGATADELPCLQSRRRSHL
jgi:hypothetical protein